MDIAVKNIGIEMQERSNAISAIEDMKSKIKKVFKSRKQRRIEDFLEMCEAENKAAREAGFTEQDLYDFIKEMRQQ